MFALAFRGMRWDIQSASISIREMNRQPFLFLDNKTTSELHAANVNSGNELVLRSIPTQELSFAHVLSGNGKIKNTK